MLDLAVISMFGALSCFQVESAQELHCSVSDSFQLHMCQATKEDDKMPVKMISQDGADMHSTS